MKQEKHSSKLDPNSNRYALEDLNTAVQVMQQGGIILYPTDTVWGIGCDATNEQAVRKIFALKQRADSKSMLCLLDGAGKLQAYVDVPSAAQQLLEVTEGCSPMTIIYPNARNVAESLIAEDGSLGIRITEERFSHDLCQKLRHPIVSTSANISGQPAAKTYGDVSEEIRRGVDYICRYRREDCKPHQPSGIIKIGPNNEVTIIR